MDTSQRAFQKKQALESQEQALKESFSQAEQQLSQYDKELHAMVAQLPRNSSLKYGSCRNIGWTKRNALWPATLPRLGAKSLPGIRPAHGPGRFPFSLEGLAKQEESNLYEQLLNKTNLVGAFADHAADAIPFFSRAVDGALETQRGLYGLDETTYPMTGFQEILNQQQIQSPTASTAGKVAGTMAEYMVGSQLMKSLPGVGKALDKAGQAVAGTQAAQAFQQIPALGHLATADAVSGILGDQILDTAFDTIPSLYDDIQTYRTQGEDGDLSVGDILGNTAKNVGFNFGMNLLGEAIQGAFKTGRSASRRLNRKMGLLQQVQKPFWRATAGTSHPERTGPRKAALGGADETASAQPVIPHLEATGDAFWSRQGNIQR